MWCGGVVTLSLTNQSKVEFGCDNKHFAHFKSPPFKHVVPSQLNLFCQCHGELLTEMTSNFISAGPVCASAAFSVMSSIPRIQRDIQTNILQGIQSTMKETR